MTNTEDDSAAEGRAPDTASDRHKAIGLMVLALTFFSALDAAAKFLATRKGLPISEIVWVRFMGQFILLLALVPAAGVMSAKALFTTSRLKLAPLPLQAGPAA